jgi:hypothetical protein
VKKKMKTPIFFGTIYCSLIVVLIPFNSEAQSYFKQNFTDTTDNAVDLSPYLSSRVGIMPYPIIITEPAVGFGGGLGLIYFHRSKEEKKSGKYGLLPPSLSMVGGIYTSNKSWMGIIAHQGSYMKDRIRYLGAIGYIDVNLTFYGAGILEKEQAYKFNMKGFLFAQELSFRIKQTPLFLGGNYLYFGNEITFKTGLDTPELKKLTENTNTGGVNLLVQYDTRDNIFTPNRGLFWAIELGYFGKALGGDTEFKNMNIRVYTFTDKIARKKVVAGFRFNSQYRWGDVPFYDLPFISLRGIPILRYQDHAVAVGETEWRWNAWRRWSLVGFTGAGFTAPKLNKFSLDQAKITYGTGFRYFIAKQYGMHIGLDFAWGPEQFAWYLTFGSAWFR